VAVREALDGFVDCGALRFQAALDSDRPDGERPGNFVVNQGDQTQGRLEEAVGPAVGVGACQEHQLEDGRRGVGVSVVVRFGEQPSEFRMGREVFDDLGGRARCGRESPDVRCGDLRGDTVVAGSGIEREFHAADS